MVVSISAALTSSSCSSTITARRPFRFIPCPNFYIPKSTSKSDTLKISQNQRKKSNFVFGVRVISCLADDSVAYSQSDESSASNGSNPGMTLDIKLPRRSLLVQFTCDACGERSQRLINRLAYEKGTVFVQCSGCLKHHKLVDNLKLVVEYDLREDDDADSKVDLV